MAGGKSRKRRHLRPRRGSGRHDLVGEDADPLARPPPPRTDWMVGLSTSGSISLGWALVAGRKRVPSPAAGNTAFLTLMALMSSAPARRERSSSAPGSPRL